MASLSISSYNCKGFLNSRDYLCDIVQRNPPLIVCLQETWHLSNHTSMFTSLGTDYLFYDTSGVDCNRSILQRRPHGGLAIFYMKSIADKIKVAQSDCKRICACVINEDGCAPLLLINVYLPCDSFLAHTVNSNYIETLSAVESLLNDHTGDAVLCGDWNRDMSRKTAQTKCFEQFLERNNLNLCWDHALVTQDNTYANYALKFSCIDHFVMNCNMFSCLGTCDVNTSPLNPSDHRDIHASWNRTIGYQNVRQSRPARDRSAWYRATDENISNYQHQLDVLLDQLCVVTNALTCDDPRCENNGHRKSVEVLREFLINSCLCAGKHTCMSRSILFLDIGCVSGWGHYHGVIPISIYDTYCWGHFLGLTNQNYVLKWRHKYVDEGCWHLGHHTCINVCAYLQGTSLS